ncbi:MAG: hypothetical protein PHG24_02785 [Candidatus Pacebacteria bacterium]|nr:hypothetical protein [Candidatus Paceibacterota bacterium]
MTAKKMVIDPHFFSFKIIEEDIETIKNLLKGHCLAMVGLENSDTKDEVRLAVRILPEDVNDETFSKYFCISSRRKNIVKAFCQNAYSDGLVVTLSTEKGKKWLTLRVNYHTVNNAKLIENCIVRITPEGFSFTTKENVKGCLNLSSEERYSLGGSLHQGFSVLIFRAIENPKHPLNGIFFIECCLPKKENLFKLYANSTFSLTSKIGRDRRTWFTFKPCKNVQTL